MPITYLLLLVAFLNFLVGFAVWRRDWRAPENWAFMGLAGSMGFWTLTNFLITNAGSERYVILGEQLAHLAGVFIAVSLWIFAHLFCFGKLNKFQWTLVGVFVAIMLSLTIWPGQFARGTLRHAWGYDVFIQPLYHISFSVLFSLFFFGGLYLLINYSRTAWNRSLARRQARCLSRGILLAATGGIFFNIVLVAPFIQQQRYVWAGPLFTIFFIFGSFTALRRYFFGVPIIARAAILIEDVNRLFAIFAIFKRFIRRFLNLKSLFTLAVPASGGNRANRY